MKTTSVQNVLDKGQWSNIGSMQMGFGFNYLKGIGKKMDAIITIDGSSTDYLFKNGRIIGRPLPLFDQCVNHAGPIQKFIPSRN
jgi:hypothetical protein